MRERGERESVDAEFAHHLAMRMAEYEAAGMTPEQAREEALRRMGDTERYRRETRAIDGRARRRRGRREVLMDAIREFVKAARSLRRSAGFAVAAVLVLGVGMGATVAMYAQLDAVVLHPLSYPAGSSLVWLGASVSGPGMSGEWGLSEAGYHQYRSESRTLSELGAYSVWTASVSGDVADAERVLVARASASLLEVLSARPAAGRLYGLTDDEPGASPVALLSHAFWVRRYGADPDVVGRMLAVDGRAIEVIGVLAAGFTLPEGSADLWLPAQLDPSARPANSHYLSAVGRLAPGQTVESAQRELSSLTARFPERFPGAYSPSFMQQFHFDVAVTPLADHVVGSAGRLLWAMLGGVFLLLLIAATNVANLFLVRADVRQREMSVRLALGAKRWHIVWHYLAESLLVSALAMALALLLAQAVLAVMPGLAPSSLPRLENASLGGSALAVMLGLALGCALVFGLAPTLRRVVADHVLNEVGRSPSASKRQHAVRRLLVAGQIALAVVLLSGAGLMLRSVSRLRSIDPGFEARGRMTMSIALPAASYDTWESVNVFERELLDRVRALPGVSGVALTTVLPIAESGYCASVFAEGNPVGPDEEPPCVSRALVSPGYFDVMGIHIDGVVPTWEDNDARSGAVVVSRALARRLWPEGGAIGRGVRPNGDAPPFYRIVGVTAGVRAEGLDEAPTEMVYYPLLPMAGTGLWSPPRDASLVVRTAGTQAASVVPAIRSLLHDMDPTVPLSSVRSMESVVASSMARRSFAMVLLAVAAAMALLLSALGVYGVVSYIVAQRQGDIGVRMALGAERGRVRSQVLLQGLALGAAGVAIGIVVALMVNRALASLLFEIQPADPVTLVLVSITMILLVALAGWGPAARAARVEPAEALRRD
jgi:predicted permease